MEKVKRIYTGRDVDMLTAIGSIVESALAHKAQLIAKRPAWADPFFDDLKTKVANVTATYLGVDDARDLRQSTVAVNTIMNDAKVDLKELKVQLETDYSKDKTKLNEVLTALGYKQFYTAAAKGNSRIWWRCCFALN